MNCQRAKDIQAYHDSELPRGEQLALQDHLDACPRCRAELIEFQRMSALISRAPLAEPPAGLIQRLQADRVAFEDRITLRWAGWLTATAAAVLLAALLSWPSSAAESPDQPAVWESVAVTPSVAWSDDPNAELAVVAQWMADNLESMENGELR